MLADICNRSWVYILPDMWAGRPNTMFTTGFHWPNQGRPPKKDWTLWQLALCQAFLVNHLLCLDHPLGKWLQLPTQSSHCWHWLTSFSTQKLYHWTRQWQIHDRHQGYLNRHQKYKSQGSGETQSIPPDCKRVTIKTAATYLTPTIGFGHMAPLLQELEMWQEYISNLPNKHKQTFQHLKLTDDGQPIVQAIMSGHMVAVSNGSFKDAQGTAAWMFYDDCDPKTLLGEGVITTPGTRPAQGSYRSKLAGIYRIIMTTNALFKYYRKTQGTLLIVCNGKAALSKSMKPWTSNPLDKQFDIIHAIQAGIQQTKIKWSSEHIKGHQNQVALDTCNKARWNDAMDQAAKTIG